MGIYESAQQEMDEWLEAAPSVWRKDGQFSDEVKGVDADGLYIHAGVFTALVESVYTVQEMLIRSGLVEAGAPSVAGQASVTNLLTMAINVFVKRHSEDVAESEVNSIDLDEEFAKLKDIFNLDTEEDD